MGREQPSQPIWSEWAAKGWEAAIARKHAVPYASGVIWRVALLLIIATVVGCTSKSFPNFAAQGSLRCGGLPTGWTTQKLFVEKLNQVPGIVDLGVSNSLLMTKEGTIFWNDKPVTDKTLRKYVDLLREMQPRPMLYVHMEDGLSCRDVETLHQLLAPICTVGNECIDTTATEWRQLYPRDPGI